jgi:hypothetical protein
MSTPSIYRRAPRGRPLIGFQLEVPGEPGEIELRDGAALTCREVRQDGKLVGELEVSVFAAALVIDRDGILAEKAREVIGLEVAVRGGATAVAVRLPGASGFRADAVQGTRLPYVYVFAIAAHDLAVDGGVLIKIRSASPDWPAAEHMLQSLRIVTRHGTAPAHDEPDSEPMLPVVAPRRD